MNRASAFLTVLAAILLDGCAAVTVRQDYDPDVDFGRYHSFAWMPVPGNAETVHGQVSGPFLDRRIRKSLLAELAARGYEHVSEGADFLLAYHLGSRPRTEVGWVGDPYWGLRPVAVSQSREAALIVDVVDPGTRQLVWRGWSVSTLQPGAHPRAEQENVDRVVHRILEQFPPHAGPQTPRR